MVFENGVKNIQAAAYNGARTVATYPNQAVKKYNFIAYPELCTLKKGNCLIKDEHAFFLRKKLIEK